MAKRKETDAKPAAPTGDAVPSAPELKASEPKLEPKLEAKSDEPKLEAKPEPKLELPRVEAPMLAPIEEPAQAEKIVPKADPIKAEAPKTEAHKAEVTKLRLAKSDVPKGDAPRLDWIKPLMAEDAPLPPRAAAVPAASPAPVRDSAPVGRFALLAASVAIAASIGAMAGGFGASGFTHVAAAPSDTPAVQAVAAEDIHALQSTVTQLRADLAGLKNSIDAGTKSTNGQFVKITERIDRVERAQAEPIAKINKAVEALERIEKRADLTPGRDVTGTVPTAQTAAASAPPQGIVSGWVVRDVYRGVAFIQGRMGVIEVEPGDVVPGVGRVEAVRKQDGRWVVVTSKGLITAPR